MRRAAAAAAVVVPSNFEGGSRSIRRAQSAERETGVSWPRSRARALLLLPLLAGPRALLLLLLLLPLFSVPPPFMAACCEKPLLCLLSGVRRFVFRRDREPCLVAPCLPRALKFALGFLPRTPYLPLRGLYILLFLLLVSPRGNGIELRTLMSGTLHGSRGLRLAA